MSSTMFVDLEEEFSSQCLLTDDIWDKFQLSNLDLNIFNNNDIDLNSIEIFSNPNDYEIRNHDCMWAGHCGSKEHSVDDIKNILVRPISQMMLLPPPAGATTTPTTTTTSTNCVGTNTTAPVVIKQSPVAPGRSLLLKTQPQLQQQLHHQQQLHQQKQNNVFSNYESPPNSDDEETKSPVLQYLQDAISECDMDDDDLYDYFEDNKGDLMGGDEFEEGEEDEEKEEKPCIEELQKQLAANARSAKISQFVNDHCYHKDKNASMRNLGIDTPSDSEEEIDVVSTDDKYLLQRSVSALPTNPTTRDRHQLQKTMASAITKNGIRTLPPVRKSSTAGGNVEHSPSKRRADSRAIKRNRHRVPTSPYKKQRLHHYQQSTVTSQMSSDSEQEPFEKRIEHNNMERQRRIDLRNAFEDLRVLVPEVSKRERAPKVIILREAAVYCHKLTDTSDSMKRQVDDMLRHQKRLRARLSQLRMSLAPKHR